MAPLQLDTNSYYRSQRKPTLYANELVKRGLSQERCPVDFYIDLQAKDVMDRQIIPQNVKLQIKEEITPILADLLHRIDNWRLVIYVQKRNTQGASHLKTFKIERHNRSSGRIVQ